MGRVDERFVGMRQQFVVQRFVEVGAQVVSGPAKRGAQVRAADIADEQRVAGQHGIGFGRILFQIENQDRNRLDGVAGRLKHFEAQPRELERIAVFHRDEGVLGLGARTEMDDRARAVAQFQVTGHEVGMEVSKEDVADLEAKTLGLSQILLYVALGIDDNGRRARFVAEQIGRVGQAAQVILLQNHMAVYSLAPRKAPGSNIGQFARHSPRPGTFCQPRHDPPKYRL